MANERGAKFDGRTQPETGGDCDCTGYVRRRAGVRGGMMTEIIIPGTPHGQGRPRATCVNGKVRMYDPPKSRAWKEYARAIMKNHACGDDMIMKPAPIAIRVVASFVRKKSNKTTDHIQKPDIDNIVKIVMDCGTGIFWEDDSQIISVLSDKFWSNEEYVHLQCTRLVPC